MSFDTYLSIGSFALGLGGFVAALWPPSSGRRPRRHLLVLLTCLVAFASTEIAPLWQDREELKHEQALSERVVAMVASEAKTADQIHEELPDEDKPLLGAVLTKLLARDEIKSRLVGMRDAAGLSYAAALYFKNDEVAAQSQLTLTR